MGSYVERLWEGDPGAYGGRRARRSFPYKAWIPDPILGFDPAITFEVAAAIDAAEGAVAALNASANVLGLEAIGPLLLRSEAIASSKIEGYELSQRNLARALIEPSQARGIARVVAANVVAMEQAIAIGEESRHFTPDDLLAVHRALMADEPDRTKPGQFRSEQNWVGGRLNSPLDARYVPPPETHVLALIEDLVRFINERDDLPAVAQAAVAHAQFETIHPFVDGNGRVGRCLIHIVLRRRGLAPDFVPPVSIVLAARPETYIAGLVDFREGRAGSWCASFAGACERAASVSIELADQVERLRHSWVRDAAVRRDSTAARIIELLPAQPIVAAATVRAALGVSHQRALAALKTLEDAGVVRQISRGSYDRQYAADRLFELIEAFEEEVSRPTWNEGSVVSRETREQEFLDTWAKLQEHEAFAEHGAKGADDATDSPESSSSSVARQRAARRWLERNGSHLHELRIAAGMLAAWPNALPVSDPHLQSVLTTARVLEDAYRAEVAGAESRSR